MYNAIINKNFEIKSNILSQKNTIYFKDDENKTNTKYKNAREKQNYYDDLYIFLISIEKAKNVNELNETKIRWDLAKYPKDLVDDKMKHSTKNKKKFNYGNKAKNYLLENNCLYFTGYRGHEISKLKIPFLNEKINIITTAHSNNGHLRINRTTAKIKEMEYFWEFKVEDIKDFIENCAKRIMSKKGKNITPKIKFIITKGPLERIVADGWELDEDLKIITRFHWVVDIIDHFSKFLMSIPIKNNNANNILCCLKEFVNYVGKPEIFQSDNGSEYKNNIIKNYLYANNIKHILSSSPRHP